MGAILPFKWSVLKIKYLSFCLISFTLFVFHIHLGITSEKTDDPPDAGTRKATPIHTSTLRETSPLISSSNPYKIGTRVRITSHTLQGGE